MDQLFLTLTSAQTAFSVLADYWWIWLPLVLVIACWEAFVHYNRLVHLAGLKWVLLEIRVPQEAHKSLNAMEQIFTSLHSIPMPWPPRDLEDYYNRWKSTYIQGKIPEWLSLEIVSISGEIHFYVRVLEESRHVVEAQIYAHYPDCEITPVADYTAQLPPFLPTADIDMSALELALIKEEIFPLKTYPEFEEQGAGKEDVKRIDPLAPLAESMSSLAFGEYLGVQILIRPTGDGWIKKGQPVLDKLMGKKPKEQKDWLEKGFTAIDSALMGAGPVDEKKDDKDKPFNTLNPGLQDTIKLIERGLSKLAFETGIRILYVAPRDRYNKSRIRSVAAAFKQFSSQALNGFRPGFGAEVYKGFNKETRTLYNKGLLYKRYRLREFPKNPFVLNTEELTTVFHFPDIGVKTPALPRIEAKKGEPPSGLPIV